MKLALAALATGLMSLSAFAHTGGGTSKGGPYERYPYYSTQVSCQEIRSAIQSAGGLIIYRAPHLYGAYVSSEYYCANHETIKSATLPTRDGSCWVHKCSYRTDRNN